MHEIYINSMKICTKKTLYVLIVCNSYVKYIANVVFVKLLSKTILEKKVNTSRASKPNIFRENCGIVVLFMGEYTDKISHVPLHKRKKYSVLSIILIIDPLHAYILEQNS